MRNLQEVFSETNGLYGRIDRILKFSTYDEYDDLSGLDIDYGNSEQFFLLDEMQAVMEKLDEVRGRLAYPPHPGSGNAAQKRIREIRNGEWPLLYLRQPH